MNKGGLPMYDEHGTFDESTATEEELCEELSAQIIDTWTGPHSMHRVRGNNKLIMKALLRTLAFGLAEAYGTDEHIWTYLVFELPAALKRERGVIADLDAGERPPLLN
jgi:hypothetical protein